MRYRICLLIQVLFLACMLAFPARGAWGTNIRDYAELAIDGDWLPAVERAMAEAPEGGVLFFPHAEYRVGGTIVIGRSVTLLLESGARLWTEADELIRIVGGERIVLQGHGGRGELLSKPVTQPVFSERGFPAEGITCVISLDHVPDDARPSLRVQGLRLRGFRGINGLLATEKGPMGEVEVLDCEFECDDIHMAHRHSEVKRLRVENCHFRGDARLGIHFTSPMPNGAIVRGNVLENIGVSAIQLSGGKASQIADGCVEYLPSATVHDNQILGGGHRANIHTSYIHGILVYGHNISIQNNIVRDFNRGEPVPGEPYGRHMRLPDGSYFRGVWIATETNPRRRLAGSALYAKARQGIIAGNICTNSGWRAVIEVKTGGREPYVMVANNIVDGSSLAIEGSFGFEPGSGQSVWTGNLIYNMPVTAFAVRGNRQSVYSNNVIYNSKSGFTIPRDGCAEELILNNRFVNVEQPVLGVGTAPHGGLVGAPPPIVTPHLSLLPDPGESHRGRIATILSPDADETYVCVRRDGRFVWAPMVFDPERAVGSQSLDPDSWHAVGKDLVLNGDHALDAPPAETSDPRWERSSRRAFPAGWSAVANPGPVAEILAYDPDVRLHAIRSLRAAHQEQAFNWLIEQPVAVEPGKTYLARATVRMSKPVLAPSLSVQWGEERRAVSAKPTIEWQTIALLFTMPEDGPPEVRLRLWTARVGKEASMWVDRVSMHEARRIDEQPATEPAAPGP